MDLEFVKKTIAEYFEVCPQALHEKTRKRAIRHARQVAITVSRIYTDFDDDSISDLFCRDRSTIVITSRKMLEEIVIYQTTRDEVIDICCLLGLPADYLIGFAQFFHERQHTVCDLPKYIMRLLEVYKTDYYKKHIFKPQTAK